MAPAARSDLDSRETQRVVARRQLTKLVTQYLSSSPELSLHSKVPPPAPIPMRNPNRYSTGYAFLLFFHLVFEKLATRVVSSRSCTYNYIFLPSWHWLALPRPDVLAAYCLTSDLIILIAGDVCFLRRCLHTGGPVRRDSRRSIISLCYVRISKFPLT